MTTLMILAASSFAGGGVIGLLFKIAIACVVAWVIWSLIKWWLGKTGTAIPQPLVIIFWGVVAIVLIYWLYELVLMLL